MALIYVRVCAILDELPGVTQRQCVACHDWWPEDFEFYQQPGGPGFPFMARCRACVVERTAFVEAHGGVIGCRVCGKATNGVDGRRRYCADCRHEAVETNRRRVLAARKERRLQLRKADRASTVCPAAGIRYCMCGVPLPDGASAQRQWCSKSCRDGHRPGRGQGPIITARARDRREFAANLRAEGLSLRAIAKAIGVDHAVVWRYLAAKADAPRAVREPVTA